MYYETLAMRYLKDTLIMTRFKAIPLPKDTIKGYSGVIIDISERGISLINDDSEKSSVSWQIISEENLLKMAQFLLKGDTNKEAHILAFANMRLHNYQDAFKYFKQLIETDTNNLIRYNDYLTKCEAGYRMYIGPKIDSSCKKAKTLVLKGNKKEAIQLMIDLFERYSDDDLGKVYQDRILFTYSSIIRS
jgi:tetratricopeptide (TPR) repeat protein